MIFSEYLVQKGLINKSDFINILLEQIKQIPSTLELLIEGNILNHEMIFSIYCFQIENNISTIEAMKALKIWDKNIETKIQEFIEQKKPSLSFLLISKNKITHEDLFSNLDNFTHEETPKKNEIVEKKNTTEQQKEKNIAFPSIEKSMIKNFSEEAELLLKNNEHENYNKEKLLQDIQSCYISSKFIKASLLENLFKSMLNGINDGINEKNKDILKKSIIIVSDALSLLKENLSEEVFWRKNKDEYLNILNKWQEVI